MIEWFIGAVGAVIIALLSAWALKWFGPKDEGHSPDTAPQIDIAKNGAAFSIHYDIGDDIFQNSEIVSGQADVFLNEKHIDTLRADHNNPFTETTATVPSPGEYSYEMRLREEALNTASGQTEVRRFAGSGTINIEAGKAYRIYTFVKPAGQKMGLEAALGLLKDFGDDVDLDKFE